MRQLGRELVLNYTQPLGSFYMLTVSKVPTFQLQSPAVAAATLFPGSPAYFNKAQLKVGSDDLTAVTILKFDIQGQTGDLGIVSAVLQLFVEKSTNYRSQILMVLGLPTGFDESSVTWDNLPY